MSNLSAIGSPERMAALVEHYRAQAEAWEVACRAMVSTYPDPAGDFDDALTGAIDLIRDADGPG